MAINNGRGLQYDNQGRVIYNPANDSGMVWDSAPQGSQFTSGYDALNTVANIVDPNINIPFASGDEALQTLTNIVEGTPSVDTPANPVINQPFSTADSLRLQMQGYQDAGNSTLADAYRNLWNGANSYSNVANQIGGFYGALADDIVNRENQLGQAKYNLANQLNQDLLSQRDYVMDMFGPNGTLSNEINQYYTDMGNYLATEAGREAANIAAQGVHSGASLGAIRAQQNEAYNNAYSRYLQAKEKEINAKQQIASNLINYMSTLRKEYGDTTNQYIISQYQRANDLLNSINTDLNNQYTQLAAAQLNTGSGGSSSASASSNASGIDTRDTTDSNVSVTQGDNQAGSSSASASSNASGIDTRDTTDANESVTKGDNQAGSNGGSSSSSNNKEQLDKPTGNGYASSTTPRDKKDSIGLGTLGVLYPVVRNRIR